MQDQSLGISIDNIIAIRTPRIRDNESIQVRMATFKEALLKNSSIIKASVVTEIPGKQIYWDAGGIMKDGQDIDQAKNYQIVGIDYKFAELFDLEFVAGRNFSLNVRGAENDRCGNRRRTGGHFRQISVAELSEDCRKFLRSFEGILPYPRSGFLQGKLRRSAGTTAS